MENQERHYNIKKLNRIFAAVSIILLICLISMFSKDYNREWKQYQREFRKLETQKTQEKYDSAVTALDENSEYAAIITQLTDLKDDATQKSADLAAAEEKIQKLTAQSELANQRYRFAKAEYDALKYEYEASLSGHGSGNSAKLKEKLDASELKLEDLKAAEETVNTSLKEQAAIVDEHTKQIKELERQQRVVRLKSDILKKKLEKLDVAKMSMANRVASVVRDLPVLELANPTDKVQQIVLKDLTDSVNFMRVPKVDRCITCHLGIANPDYKDAPQPFRTHPNLDLFVSNDSAHSMEEFGCTVCHQGRGRGTNFLSAVHAPASPEQQKEWEEKYRWEPDHHWEEPMLPMPYVEASCLKCHSGQTVVKGAQKLNLGLNLIERAGCYGCHLIERYKDWPKVGPDLTKTKTKLDQEWLYRWISDPQAFRHNTWMPGFFNQSNNSDPESQKRIQQEVLAIVHYLTEKSEPFKEVEMPVNSDAKRGEEIVASYGCFGCHQVQHEKIETPATLNTLKREQGPNLIGLGTKTNAKWLFNWLKDPKRYHSGTRMPDMRLSDQEAADVTAYLISDKNADFSNKIVPVVDETVLNGILREFLARSLTGEQTEEKIKSMLRDEKLSFAGEKLIRHYGCFGCHNIAGFENEKPIGAELTEVGSKSVDRLDFGFVDIQHTRQAWFNQKLKDPRSFDKDRVRSPYEQLRMPNFYFTDAEIEAVTTALLSFVEYHPDISKIKPRTPKNLFIEEGQALVRQFNCQGCHIMEGEGGAINEKVTDWLVQFGGRSEAEARSVTVGFSPPDLIGEGQKIQAEWLFEFLHSPKTIRPWLKVRMPTFNFSPEELNTFLKYFNYLDDQEFPFTAAYDVHMTPEEYTAGKKLFSVEYFDCASCHIVGDKFPSGSPDRWAPDFALAHDRLKPEWIIKWLSNPQALQPGTKMPTYFDPQYFDQSGPDDLLNGDEHEQIRVLRDYIMSLSAKGTGPAPTGQSVPAASSTTNP